MSVKFRCKLCFANSSKKLNLVRRESEVRRIRTFWLNFDYPKCKTEKVFVTVRLSSFKIFEV